MKGFTLIELMVIMALVGILAASVIGAYRDHNNIENVDLQTTDGIPTIYISNDRRSPETVKMQHHSDGSLWACKENAECYEVR